MSPSGGDLPGPDASDGVGGVPDEAVTTVPLETEDGDEVTIAQEPVGPGNEVGSGELPPPSTPPTDPDDAA